MIEYRVYTEDRELLITSLSGPPRAHRHYYLRLLFIEKLHALCLEGPRLEADRRRHGREEREVPQEEWKPTEFAPRRSARAPRRPARALGGVDASHRAHDARQGFV